MASEKPKAAPKICSKGPLHPHCDPCQGRVFRRPGKVGDSDQEGGSRVGPDVRIGRDGNARYTR